MSNFIGLAGIAVILGIAFAFSSNRKAVNLRIVGAAFALQVVIATIVLYWDKGRAGIEWLSNGVMAVIGFWASASPSTSCRSSSSFPR